MTPPRTVRKGREPKQNLFRHRGAAAAKAGVEGAGVPGSLGKGRWLCGLHSAACTPRGSSPFLLLLSFKAIHAHCNPGKRPMENYLLPPSPCSTPTFRKYLLSCVCSQLSVGLYGYVTQIRTLEKWGGSSTC